MIPDRPTEGNWTEDFKRQVEEATKAVAAQVAFWKEWIPGGLRKRKRYRTKAHGTRRKTARRKNKAARQARRYNRKAASRPKGRRKP